MQVQALVMAIACIYGVQQLCVHFDLSPGLTMGLQIGAALILPRFAAKALATTIAGKKAPLLDNLKYVQGEPIKVEPGRVNVIEFWATWCPPCTKSIPHLNDLYQRFKDKGVGFVGVSGENEDVIKPFLAKTPAFSYPCATDPGSKTIKEFGVSGIPASFVIGKDGTVFWQLWPLGGHLLVSEFERFQMSFNRQDTPTTTADGRNGDGQGHPTQGLDEAIEKALAGETAQPANKTE